MRPLESRSETERKEARTRKILVIFLGAIMLAGTLGIAFQNQIADGTTSLTEIEYNGYKFTDRNGLWVYGNYIFSYLPQEVPDTGAVVNGAASYAGRPVYLYSEDINAEIEAFANLGQIALRVQEACPVGEGCAEGIPEKTCSDNFIIIKEDTSSTITQEGGCVYVKGPSQDLVALTDEFLYKILGIK